MDFACKRIKFEELIKCSFGLNKTDYNLFMFLIKKRNYLTIKEISDLSKLERSTVQKSAKRLAEKNLVEKHQDNLDKGGYIYSYKIRDKEIIKKWIQKILENWSIKVKEEIERW